MYATLLREGDDDPADVSTTTTTTTATSTANTIVKDLKSSEFWNFDYQTTTAMDKEYEIQVGTSTTTTTTTGTTSDGNEGIELVNGVEIKAGDKIQATCVYNSMYREKKTRFGLSTYDEMCIVTIQVTFKTPPVALVDDINGGTVSGIDFGADFNLRSFSCELVDDSTDDNNNNEDSLSTSSSTTSPVVVVSDI